LGVLLLILLVIIVVIIVLQRRKKSNMRAILKRSRDLTGAGEGLVTNKGQER
jgi:preprotein translocase subunit SecG